MTSNKTCQAVPVFSGSNEIYRTEECPSHPSVRPYPHIRGVSVPSVRPYPYIRGVSVPSVRPYPYIRGVSVSSLQLSQRGVHFFVKIRHGTCVYRKQQEVKPLSATEISGQQSQKRVKYCYCAGCLARLLALHSVRTDWHRLAL